MEFRYPDRPAREIAPCHMDALGREYLACLKLDGFRCLVQRSLGEYSYLSRVNKPMAVPAEVRARFERFCDQHFRGQLILDCELTGRRRAGDQQEIFILDFLMIDGMPMYRWPALERLRRFEGPTTYTVPWARWDSKLGWKALFDQWRYWVEWNHGPCAEGIVFRKEDSIYIGSPIKAAENPAWIKTRWRAGSSGLVPTETGELVCLPN